MINVTKTFLPPFEEYAAILKRAWDKAWITNNGELVQELESMLKEYLAVDQLLYTSNGTVVLQIALKALNITKEVITTPFSYVATTNALLWEKCSPVFVDIDPGNFCIDADKIEAAITENTQAILATHVYGLPCNVEKIGEISLKHNLKVIYDGAHAFGCIYKGKSLLSYGDISTCSFHATKLFHTVEGGCLISHYKEMNDQLFLYRSFGHLVDDYYCVGINAKNSEFHAAMGLALLPYINSIIEERKELVSVYDSYLSGHVQLPVRTIKDFTYNHSYYPIVVQSEDVLLKLKISLEAKGVNVRRYFYPSLNTLPFLPAGSNSCPISEDISKRVLCLPLYPSLKTSEVKMIAEHILSLI